MTTPATTKFEKLAAQVRKASGAAAEAIGELRAQIEDIKARIEVLRVQPCTRAEVEARARVLIQRLAGQSLAVGAALIDPDPPYPEHVFAKAMDALRGTAAAEMMAALMPEAFLDALMHQADRAATAHGGWGETDAAARKAELERLSDHLLALEHQEEALIMASAEMGLAIARRPDADPRAVLGLDRPPMAGPPGMRDDELSEIPAAG